VCAVNWPYSNTGAGGGGGGGHNLSWLLGN